MKVNITGDINISLNDLFDSLEIAMTKKSEALVWKSNQRGRLAYPAIFNNKVPLKVRLSKDFNELRAGSEFFVRVNSYGATRLILPNKTLLDAHPDVFEVIEWHVEK